MKFSPQHWLGLAVAFVILLVDFALFYEKPYFFFLLGIAAVAGVLPFLVTLIIETGREREKESMFLEFCRNLSEGVAAGIPISKNIVNISNKDYGSLTPHVRKLANQISLGIPLRKAFQTFASDAKNKIIKKSVSIIIEAEQSGGEIGSTLDSVAKSVSEIEDIKKERRSSLYNQIIQGYIIFFVFIFIMLILQLWLLPKMQEVTLASVEFELNERVLTQEKMSTLNNVFFALILIQGFLAGLVIGKLSEGQLKPGLKHSAILVILAYLIFTGVRILKG